MSQAEGKQGTGGDTPGDPQGPRGSAPRADDIGFENPPPPVAAEKPPAKPLDVDPDKTPPPGTLPPPTRSFGQLPMPDRDFDAVGFGGFEPVANVDDDDTPSGGIFIGGEEVQVIDANALGRALAQAQGLPVEDAGPNLELLRKGLVGIDLGAAVAVIARFNEDGKHEIVPNADDELGTQPVVFYDEDGEQLVGKEALRLAPSAPDRAFVEAKTLLGNAAFKRPVHNATVDAEQLVTIIAKRLLDDAQRRTGSRPTHAALAAPVWFKDAQRAALERAVTKAGIEVVGVTDEPLAATVPYSLRLEDLNPRKAAVFDLGHSGLGCAIVRCAKGDIEILKAEARRDLGATRFDDIIAEEAARNFREQHGFDPRDEKGAAIDLRIRVEEAKKALSQRQNVTVVVASRGKTSKIAFQRPAFEDAAKKLVDEAMKFFRKVRDAAGVKDWSEINAVIVTGGGTRMPLIRRAIKKETSLDPEKAINPDEGVAIGALYWGLVARSRAGKTQPPAAPKKS